MTADGDCHVIWVAGPDAGGRHSLPVGRSLLGRAENAAVRCDDPMLQPFHAVLDRDADGAVWCTSLSARPPLRLAGQVLAGRALWPLGARLEVGHSVLELAQNDVNRNDTAQNDTAQNDTVGLLDDAVVRRPRAVPCWTPAELVPPMPPVLRQEPPGGLAPAVIGVIGSAAMALLFHQLLFVVFGALGASVALGSWLVQRGAGARRRRHDDDEHAAALLAYEELLAADRAEFLAAHLAATPTPGSARHLAERLGADLWSRRRTHPDGARVSIGLGEVVWRRRPVRAGGTQPIEPMLIDAAPVPADLGPGARLALHGWGATAVARSLLVQLATSCGPGDLRVIVVTPEPTDWRWIVGLPHAALADGRTAILAAADLPDALVELQSDSPTGAPHVVLVVDDGAALSTLTSVVRRALQSHPHLALLAVLADDQPVPHVCTSVFSVSSSPSARWVPETAVSLLPIPVRWAGIGVASATACVASLSRLRDPEDPLVAIGRVPRHVSLSSLLGLDLRPDDAMATIIHRWQATAFDAAPRTPIGIAAGGTIDIDLVRDGPHSLVAGTTGSGKSELLRSLVVGLAAGLPPTHLQFVLVDYKGGATFDSCAELPHVCGVVTDLDAHLAERVVRSLQAELRRREALLRERGVADLSDLRNGPRGVELARLVVVIDEFAALVVEQPTFLHSLVGIAQRGRSLGVHLVLATQRPAGAITDDIRANTALRVALRLPDAADSVDVVGDDSAARLPRRLPGRAVMRLGADERVVFQSAQFTASLVDAIRSAAAMLELEPAAPPWQPPLPQEMSGLDIEPGAIGLLDDPDRQRRDALRWTAADGSVVVVGSEGAGVTSTLHTFVAGALSTGGVDAVYVITAGMNRLSTVDRHPACASVTVHDHERLHRLLCRVAEGSSGVTLLVVDDLDSVRRTLDAPSTVVEYELLDAVLSGHRARDLVVLAGVHHSVSLPSGLLARCANRVVLHVHDAHDALALGVRPTNVPPSVPGRAFVLPHALSAQLRRPGPLPAATTDVRHDRVRIDVVPTLVDPDELPHGQHGIACTVVPLGVDFTTTAPFLFTLADDEHLLVAGPARSGRSAALSRFTEGWREAHPDGRVVALLPRRSGFDLTLADRVVDGAGEIPLATRSSAGRTLLVVDDAELVDDGDGALREFLSRLCGVEVIAAGRADTLRQSYGHWTSLIRRHRQGLLATSCGELDGDLMGVALPRTVPVAPRPGLMWVVQHGDARLVQVACRRPFTEPGVGSGDGRVLWSAQ